MRIPIRNKLIATYLLISLLTALLIYLLTHFTTERRVNELAKGYQLQEMVEEILAWYAAEESWDGFATYFKDLHPPPPPVSEAPDSKQVEVMKKVHGILDSERRVLLPYHNFDIGEIVPKAYLAEGISIEYQGGQIAWIVPPESTGISLQSEMRVFLDNINEILVVAVFLSVLCSLLMGIILARLFLRPVESLTKAAKRIATGQLEQQVLADTNDEIADLSEAFNRMSQDLVTADRQRKQLTADITHDLGTPVQVISGYIEMAQEGALALNQQRLDTIAKEIEHINRLLKDMGLLAKTDAQTLSLELTTVKIEPIVQRVARLFGQGCSDRGIKLISRCETDLPDLELDEERMIQVLGNLMSNAIRYTPKHGQIAVHAYMQGEQLMISVTDTGGGISAQDLPYVFDRFYRANNSRSGTPGKMGLGLTIAKGLVEMQGGSIDVSSKGEGQGARFCISFPR